MRNTIVVHEKAPILPTLGSLQSGTIFRFPNGTMLLMASGEGPDKQRLTILLESGYNHYYPLSDKVIPVKRAPLGLLY